MDALSGEFGQQRPCLPHLLRGRVARCPDLPSAFPGPAGPQGASWSTGVSLCSGLPLRTPDQLGLLASPCESQEDTAHLHPFSGLQRPGWATCGCLLTPWPLRTGGDHQGSQPGAVLGASERRSPSLLRAQGAGAHPQVGAPSSWTTGGNIPDPEWPSPCPALYMHP